MAGTGTVPANFSQIDREQFAVGYATAENSQFIDLPFKVSHRFVVVVTADFDRGFAAIAPP